MPIKSNLRQLKFSAVDRAFLLTLTSASLLLLLGLMIPAFTNDRLAQDMQSFSIIGGALNLGGKGSPGFMIIILLFSVVFPIAKLVAMFLLWLMRVSKPAEKRGMDWLEILGKWSMLDVFVVTITIGAAHLKLLNKTAPETGIYVFGLAIIISMIASVLLRHKLAAAIQLNINDISVAERLLGIGIGLITLIVFFFGLVLPLFQVEKWVFWNKDYSIITALPEMLTQGEYLLPLAIIIFVILLPLIRFFALTITRLLPQPPAGLIKFTFGLEKWTMWEVYALAMIIVAIKLADVANVEPKAGFWLILAVAPLSLLDGWLFKRRLHITHEDQ